MVAILWNKSQTCFSMVVLDGQLYCSSVPETCEQKMHIKIIRELVVK